MGDQFHGNRIIFEKSHKFINSYGQFNKIRWFNAIWFQINHCIKAMESVKWIYICYYWSSWILDQKIDFIPDNSISFPFYFHCHSIARPPGQCNTFSEVNGLHLHSVMLVCGTAHLFALLYLSNNMTYCESKKNTAA